MSLNKTVLFLACFFALDLSSLPAEAHPHAWIDYRTQVILNDDNKVIALKEHWVFDSTYTEFALHDFNKGKGGGKLDHKLLMDLAAENLKNLKDVDYFTIIEDRGGKKKIASVSDPHSYLVDGKIALDFTVWLKDPADVVKNKVDYMIYDPSYYVSMLHDKKDAIALKGKNASSCTSDLTTPNPNKATVSLAAAIDKNGKAPDDLGTYFAQRMTITCK
jgi:ABC-type uncharacterized transport system substrate-binding protein